MDETPSQLEAEALAAIAGAPPDPQITAPAPAPAGPTPADIEAGYVLLTNAVLSAGCEAICPAWNVTDTERDRLSGALAHACALWFPAEIPEKYVALLVVAGVGFQIVASRRDPKTGRLLPRHVEEKAAPSTAPAPH